MLLVNLHGSSYKAYVSPTCPLPTKCWQSLHYPYTMSPDMKSDHIIYRVTHTNKMCNYESQTLHSTLECLVTYELCRGRSNRRATCKTCRTHCKIKNMHKHLGHKCLWREMDGGETEVSMGPNIKMGFRKTSGWNVNMFDMAYDQIQ
jgi:hypothetical protein